MVLDTFTREELISTFLKVVPIFKKRAVNYTEHNVNDLFKKIKDGVYYKCFTGIVDGQRYYYDVAYTRNGKGVSLGEGPISTIVNNDRRKLVITFHPDADPNSKDGDYLKVHTEHFLTRYCERLGLESDDMTLIEKSNAFGRSEDNSYGATVCGNFLKKYGDTRLKATFLNQEDFSVWYAASHRGDVAIVELYGKIPVWRTFISEAMLYDSQTNDPYYQLIKDMTSKQMKAVDYIEYLNQSKDNHI